MKQIQRAWEALKTDHVAVASYVILGTAMGLAHYLAIRMLALDPEVTLPSWYYPYKLTTDLVLTVCFAGLQSVCFAFLGRSIDRPLWKCSSAMEALQRFFPTWFLLNLVTALIVHLQLVALNRNNGDVFDALGLVLMVYFIVHLPIGVALMHASRFREWTFAEALAPLGRRFGQTLIVLLVMLIQFTLHLVVSRVPDVALPRDIINHASFTFLFSWLDLLAFAATWRLCMDDRDAGAQEDNDPFDF